MKRAKLQDMTVDQLVERFHRHRPGQGATPWRRLLDRVHGLPSVGFRSPVLEN